MKKSYLSKVLLSLTSLILTGTFIAGAHHAPKKRIKIKHTAPVSKYSRLANMNVNNVLFGFNKITVPFKSYTELDKVAKLMANSSVSLKLGGYADNKGGYVYNWKLSKKRADAVKAYLVSKGADSSKIAATEYGFTHPVASNATPSGRQKNRRVEIHFAN